jgi:hypothetical protein
MLRIVCLAAVLIFAAALTTSAQVRRARVIAENAKLRETPAMLGLAEGEVPEGAIVKVLDEKLPWYVIRVGDRVGWIHGATLQFLSDPEPTLQSPQTRSSETVNETPTRASSNTDKAQTAPSAVTQPPSMPSPVRSNTERTDLIRGPRGGCYYINSSGRMVYVDRSKCN